MAEGGESPVEPLEEKAPQPCPKGCPPLQIYRNDFDGERYAPESLLPGSLATSAFRSSPVTVICAFANNIGNCERCKQSFGGALKIPTIWWNLWCKRANGYFGSEETTDEEGNADGYNTYSRFLVKKVLKDPPKGKKDYIWYKYNIFTRWIAATRHTIVVLFEPDKLEKDILLKSLLCSVDRASLDDPYWAHLQILEDVISKHDDAIWAIRGLVRELELHRESPDEPNPDYPRLHDTARHAIHVSETMDLATRAINQIKQQHREFFDSHNVPESVHRNIRRHLDFFSSMLESLMCRAASNKERLLNEIQLTFNTVAQYDARISVEVARATQYDGATMKIVSFMGMTFLPATFVCALFSMSFFNYDPDKGWHMSAEFWIYWAVAIPITCATALIWVYWQRVFPPHLVNQVQLRPRGDPLVRKETMAVEENLKGKISAEFPFSNV